jgi:hypothetical protein
MPTATISTLGDPHPPDCSRGRKPSHTVPYTWPPFLPLHFPLSLWPRLIYRTPLSFLLEEQGWVTWQLSCWAFLCSSFLFVSFSLCTNILADSRHHQSCIEVRMLSLTWRSREQSGCSKVVGLRSVPLGKQIQTPRLLGNTLPDSIHLLYRSRIFLSLETLAHWFS